MIRLIKNNGYKWVSKDGVHFKGFFFVGDILYKPPEAICYFKNVENKEHFLELIRNLNGSFSVVIEREMKVFAAVDRARSMPLYFSDDFQIISDCSEDIRKLLGIEKQAVNRTHLYELLANNYLMFNKTVYSEIRQLNLGQALTVENGIGSVEYYYRHVSSIKDIEEEQAKSMLREKTYNAFKRLKQIIAGRPVVLSLSGGYDSRLVACMLKEFGVENVSCYTYGRFDSSEIQLSKKIAENLGYRWRCVEYTDAMIKSIFSEKYKSYFAENLNHDYSFYLQNLLAVTELQEEGWFEKGSVFLTGLCGDLPSGAYVVTSNYFKDQQIDEKFCAMRFYEDHYLNKYQPNTNIEVEILHEIYDDIKTIGIDIKNIQDYVRVYDCLETGSVHSRAYLHANKPHEFIGGEWLLPLWDNDWLEYWYSLPMRYRTSQNLYEQWMQEGLFEKYDVAFKKERIFKDSYQVRKMQLRTRAKYKIGGIIAHITLTMGIPLKRKVDYNNFSVGSVVCYKDVKNRRLINYMKGNFATIFTTWVCEQHYGAETVKESLKLVESFRI